MGDILYYLLAGALAYLMLIGLKDKEPPNISIKYITIIEINYSSSFIA